MRLLQHHQHDANLSKKAIADSTLLSQPNHEVTTVLDSRMLFCQTCWYVDAWGVHVPISSILHWFVLLALTKTEYSWCASLHRATSPQIAMTHLLSCFFAVAAAFLEEIINQPALLCCASPRWREQQHNCHSSIHHRDHRRSSSTNRNSAVPSELPSSHCNYSTAKKMTYLFRGTRTWIHSNNKSDVIDKSIY